MDINQIKGVNPIDIKKVNKFKGTKIYQEIEESFTSIMNYIPKNIKEEESKEEILTVLIYLINEYFANNGKPFNPKLFMIYKNLTTDIKKLDK
jgi:mannose-6-phosphate isomerase class I